ncbi:putative quinol monooxygenase [Alicyclobacillus tolerans]|uniref:putative quinol monooxygenase n=1 Tax=Alicyclobacillus tolerans TaxID=90970 RepID=UPI003B7EC4BB
MWLLKDGGENQVVVLAARYECKPGTSEQVQAALMEMKSLVQKESGCLLYLVNRSLENPDVFLLFEQYENEQALEAHAETDYFQRLVKETILPLLAKRDRELYRPL